MKSGLTVFDSCLVLAILIGTIITALPGTGKAGEECDESVKRFEIGLQGGKPQLDDNVLRVTLDDCVQLAWQSDEPVLLHLHGYDREFRVEPGVPTVITFRAYATGRFPVTRHGLADQPGHGHETLVYLEVHPR